MTRVLGEQFFKQRMGGEILIARPARYIGPVKPGYTILIASDGWTDPYDYIKHHRPAELAQVHAIITNRGVDVKAKSEQLIALAQEISRRHLVDEKGEPSTNTSDNTTVLVIDVDYPRPVGPEEKEHPFEQVKRHLDAQSVPKVEYAHIEVKHPKKWWKW
jgi:serine/threonine protein phosphatase PrpC